MAGVGLALWKEDGTEVYYNPKCAFMIASVYSQSLSGSYAIPAIAGRKTMIIARGKALSSTGAGSAGGISNSEQSVKIVNNVLTWNIPNTRPQQIGGLFAPFSQVWLRFFVVVV